MKALLRLACSVSILALAACQNHDAPATVSGVAAIGAPISSGDIVLHCADGNTYTTTTAGTGFWSAPVQPNSLPCAVRVSGGFVNNIANAIVLYSMAQGALPATANVTPLTDMAMAYAIKNGATQTPDAWFNGSFDATTLAQVRAQIAAASDAVRTQLENSSYLASGGATFDPFTAQLIAGAINDLYDQMLDAIAQALDDAGKGYGDMRDAMTTPGASVPDAPEGFEPVNPAGPGNPANPTGPVSTPLPSDKLGASFDDADAAHLWISTTGGITVLNATDGGVVHVVAADKDHVNGNHVAFLRLPNKVGTYHCGDAVASTNPPGTMQMLVTFDDISDVQKNYTSSDTNDASLPGYSCTVTVTHVGVIDSDIHYDDDVIEGTFTAKLRQRVRPCTGEGASANCPPYKELTVNNGKFRINKTGTYTPPAGGQTGTLAARIGKAFAGTYTVSCPEKQGVPDSTHTIVINNDGGSTLDGDAISDAAHTGEINLSGHSVNAAHRTATANSPAFLLQFDDQGKIVTFGANIVNTPAGGIKLCKGVTGSVNPTAFNITGEIGGHARSQILTCPQINPANGAGSPASPVGQTTFTVSSDGSVVLGSLSVPASEYLAYATYSAGDYVTFQDPDNDYVLGVGNSMGNIKMDWTLDAAGNTIKVHYQNKLETGTCTVPASN